jgi:hypothetical protein
MARFLLEALFGRALGRVMAPIAVLWLGIAAIILMIAWNSWPRQQLEDFHFQRLTETIDGRVVESWLAVEIEFDDEIGDHPGWRPFSTATPCLVVEYEPGQWAGQLQRAFCGTRLPFTTEYHLDDLKQLTPGVPFFWQRDGHGFAVPEIRLSQAAFAWLSNAPAATPAGDSPPETALAELQRSLDRPIEYAVAGWSTPPPVFPLAFDPRNPADSLPTGYVAERAKAEKNLIIFVMFSGFGLLAWNRGIRMMFGDLREEVIWVLILLPLMAIPWWGETLPRALRHFDVHAGNVFVDMFADLDPLARLVAGEVSSAQRREGARLKWLASHGLYADTFGRLDFAPPPSPPASANAALRLLAESSREQVLSLPAGDQVALFSRLRQDKLGNMPHAGLVFVAVAREILLASGSGEEQRKSAASFLSAWLTQPVLEPDPEKPTFAEHLRLFRQLTQGTQADIAIRAQWVVTRAEATSSPVTE